MYSGNDDLDHLEMNCTVVGQQLCPWSHGVVHAMLLGTHDHNSPLHKLRTNYHLLELIIVRWVWPELFLNALIVDVHKANSAVVTEAKLREGLKLNPDGSINNWDLSRCNLMILPDSFCSIRVSNNLLLCRNKLRSLPDSFGLIKVCGHLSLSNNVFNTLPNSFASITVGGDLKLDRSNIKILPDSFGSITVGGELRLDHNKLSELPDSFGSITVGGNLRLDYNKLSELPDSFGSITVGGGLWLDHNSKLKDIPAVFPNVGEVKK